MPRRINRGTVVLGAAVLSTRWVRVNVSPSVPYGLYRLTAVPAQLARGMLVVLPVPPEVQAWHSRWLPLLKPVAALAGDTGCVRDARLWIEGVWYGPVLEEARERPLPRMVGCVTLAADEVFLASPARHALDGRYFGVLPVSALTAQAVPLLTW